MVFTLFSSYGAYAADTGELPCKTTEQCAAQAAKVGASVDTSQASHKAKGDPTQTQFAWLNRINKASIVMLTEEGIVKPDMGRKIAGGVRYAIDQARSPAACVPAMCCNWKKS